MPKGYGYDKAPKKSAAFKMKGYAYAGDSPMKQQPVGSFSTQQKLEGNLVPNQELMNANVSAPKKSFGDSFKSAMGTEVGQAVGKAVVEGAVNLVSAHKPACPYQ